MTEALDSYYCTQSTYLDRYMQPIIKMPNSRTEFRQTAEQNSAKQPKTLEVLRYKPYNK